MRKSTDRIEIKGCMELSANLLKGMKFLFVGGAVRDCILGREPKDVDIVIFSSVDDVSKLLKSKPFIINERFSTARFMLEGCCLDVNICEGSIDDELERRDFTVNSIAAYPDGTLYDPFCGAADIEKGIIRSRRMGNMDDDPLRMLRALRFEMKFGMRIDRSLKAYIRQNAALIRESAAERIFAELSSMLSEGRAGSAFERMRELGLLTAILPELEESSKFIHIKHKTRFLIRHLTRSAEAVDEILASDLPAAMKDYAEGKMTLLYLSALLHDIEKPAAFTMDFKRQRFNNHDLMGAEKSSAVLRKRFKMSNSDIDRIARMIGMHMRPHLLIYSEVSRRGLYRLSRDAGSDLEGLFIVAMADALASEGSVRSEYLELYKRVKSLEDEISAKSISFINGNDVMERFSLSQSKEVGKLIRLGNEYAVAMNVRDKDEILDYLEREREKRRG